MDRRALFFLLAAVVAGALIPVVPDDPDHPFVAWIGPILVIGYLVLAVLSLLDSRSHNRQREKATRTTRPQ